MKTTILSAVWILSGSILLAAAAISNGGGYSGELGTIFLIVGVLLSLWEPIKKWIGQMNPPHDPS